MSGPLDGLRVLDFTHVLAGPFATRVLGDMGADVVKINSAKRINAVQDPDHPYYLMWNRNKRALALDMSKEGSRKICHELCRRADVVIDNFSVGVLDRWGIGYEEISSVNSKVIYVQMSGMGEGGPWSNFVTYAPTIHALCGLTHLTGVEGRENIGVGFSYNDHQAGLHGAVAILAALESRQKMGRGQRVDLSQFEVGVNFSGPSLLDYFANGKAARLTGNRLPYDSVAPHGCYPCAGAASGAVEDERWVAIACMTDEHWRALRELMGNPLWAEDSSYETASGRVEALESIDQGVAAWTEGLEAGHVMMVCQSAGVPAGIVQNAIDLNERDPQLQESGFLHRMEAADSGGITTFADKLPLRFRGTPCDVYERVHSIGQDNKAVLRDWLDMPDNEFSDAEEAGYLS